MIIEGFYNEHGASGCCKCKSKNARWKITLRLGNCGQDSVENTMSALLCSDCAELDEAQLRAFFLG